MTSLTIDLDDAEDLRYAQELIAARLEQLGGAEETAVHSALAAEDIDDRTATEYAQRLWQRITTENTRALVRGFAEAGDGPISLEDIAEYLHEDYRTIKARKFRFGRTENKLFEEFGVALLEKEWSDAEYRYKYEMNPGVRSALLQIMAADPR